LFLPKEVTDCEVTGGVHDNWLPGRQLLAAGTENARGGRKARSDLFAGKARLPIKRRVHPFVKWQKVVRGGGSFLQFASFKYCGNAVRFHSRRLIFFLALIS
jgi:hypothetical protein